jgi:hypothetical protein
VVLTNLTLGLRGVDEVVLQESRRIGERTNTQMLSTRFIATSFINTPKKTNYARRTCVR